eukprot:7385178-Prymnesium_polylepis.1
MPKRFCSRSRSRAAPRSPRPLGRSRCARHPRRSGASHTSRRACPRARRRSACYSPAVGLAVQRAEHQPQDLHTTLIVLPEADGWAADDLLGRQLSALQISSWDVERAHVLTAQRRHRVDCVERWRADHWGHALIRRHLVVLGVQVAASHAAGVVLDNVALAVDLLAASPHGLHGPEVCDAGIVGGD